MNTCVICGAPSLGAKKNGSPYKCCESCRARYRNRYQPLNTRPPAKRDSCTGCGAQMQCTRTAAGERYCLDCRRAGLAPSRVRHGTSRRYKSGCRCDACKDSNRESMRRYYANRRASGSPITGSTYARREPRTCEHCTAEFMARTDAPGRFCSTECAKSFQGWTGARRPGRFPMTPSRRHAIYERDAWVCQICHEPTDPSADSSSDWFPSLDHIHPRSRGGDNSDENLQTAHRVCNSRKGALAGV